MVISTLTSKGRIVIPSQIRRHLGLKEGMRLCITEEKNKIVVQPLTSKYFIEKAGFLNESGRCSKSLLRERKKDRKRENVKK